MKMDRETISLQIGASSECGVLYYHEVPEAMKIWEKYRKNSGYYKEITSFWAVSSLNPTASRALTLPVPTEYCRKSKVLTRTRP